MDETLRIVKAPVVGTKQLRPFAGGMAFIAGLVPLHLCGRLWRK